jgi:hypothetical protein
MVEGEAFATVAAWYSGLSLMASWEDRLLFSAGKRIQTKPFPSVSSRSQH